MSRLMGIDLAWKSSVKPSGIAVGYLQDEKLFVESLESRIVSPDALRQYLKNNLNITGIAVDAPLLVPNTKGARPCEKNITHKYGGRHGGANSSNRTLMTRDGYQPIAINSVIEKCGYRHLSGPKWVLECFPLPTLIELFDLSMAIKYKKGRVANKKAGQIQIAELLSSLETPAFHFHDSGAAQVLDPGHISSLRGRALKANEDQLDALVCLYVAARYQMDPDDGIRFGDLASGYIWIPNRKA